MKTRFLYLLFSCTILFSCKKEKDNPDPESDKITIPTIHPDSSGSNYSFKIAEQYFEVNKDTGARISSLKFNEKEFLYVTKAGNNNWGSTFWSSPQSTWNWPPPANLDQKPYTAKNDSLNVVLTSSNASGSGYSYTFKKQFSASAEDTSFQITYSILNTGGSSTQVAPWEITRVPAGGLTFFPKGDGAMSGLLVPLMKDSLNVIWFDYDSSKIPSGVPKLLSDGKEGWIAHVNNDGVILIKKFTDSPVSSKAPGSENEIELYTDPAKAYVEVEQQGAYVSVNAGSETEWPVIWYLRKVPAGIPLTTGSQKLLDYVRSVIQ